VRLAAGASCAKTKHGITRIKILITAKGAKSAEKFLRRFLSLINFAFLCVLCGLLFTV
jgi:hypothetical protein